MTRKGQRVCLLSPSLCLQGEPGPPGQTGPEGPGGQQGSPGTQGRAVQGPMVSAALHASSSLLSLFPPLSPSSPPGATRSQRREGGSGTFRLAGNVTGPRQGDGIGRTLLRL